MVIIRLRADHDWYKANWVFRQLCADVAETYAAERGLWWMLELAQMYGMLDLTNLEPAVAERLLQMIVDVAGRVVRGDIDGWSATHPADADGQRAYVTAMAELLEKCRT